MYKLGLINGLVYRDKTLHEENIFVEEEEISLITKHGETFECDEIVDCRGRVILPGFIDPHVHINLDLGEFRSSDDYKAASKVAALGGITTFIDFLEPIEDEDAFNNSYLNKLNESMSSSIDYSFHTCIGNFKGDLKTLISNSLEQGINTIKVFTTYSDSDRRCNDVVLSDLLELTAEGEMMVMCHTENDDMIINGKKREQVIFYESTRPLLSEVSEVAKLAEMASFHKGKLYFVHITSGASVKLLQDRYGDLLGENIFIESCPHYFYLSKDKYLEDNNNLFLIAPPLRSKDEIEELSNLVNHVNTIGTDHCPFTREEKFRYSKISKIPKGIGGLEHSFRLMYTKFGLDIVDKFTINPAKIFGLYPKKGIVEVGSDGDLVILDQDFVEILGMGNSDNDYNPYQGIEVRSRIVDTILRGNFVVKDGKFVGGKGRYLRRGS